MKCEERKLSIFKQVVSAKMKILAIDLIKYDWPDQIRTECNNNSKTYKNNAKKITTLFAPTIR